MADTSADTQGAAHKHPWHLVEASPRPIQGAISSLLLFGGAVMVMHEYAGGSVIFVIGVIALLVTMFFWFRDVVQEATFGGYHTPAVQIGMRYGMALFIASEVMFFSAWFWAFFNASLFPPPAIEGIWPPPGVVTFDPWELPFLNTLILLTSGVTVTWAHHALIAGNRQHMLQGLALTILLGLTFTGVQAYEYSCASASTGPTRGISNRTIISGSKPPPGTGISSTWCGCSCSFASTGGDANLPRRRLSPAMAAGPAGACRDHLPLSALRTWQAVQGAVDGHRAL